jgi:DNA-binding XRE family transcriptional regulator/tetratricopeptide (TPR) repeat protein
VEAFDDAERRLARRLGSEMRRLRERRHLTQGALARKAGHYSRSTIATIETGCGKCSLKLIQRCDETLGARGSLVRIYLELKDAHVRHRQAAKDRPAGPREEEVGRLSDAAMLLEPLLSFADPPEIRTTLRIAPERSAGAAASPWQQPAGPAVGLPLATEGRLVLMAVPVPRRHQLPAPSAQTGLLSAWGDQERLDAVVAGRARADAQVAHQLEAVLAHYRELDDLIGPQRMLGPVQAFTAAIDLVRQDSTAGVQRALLSMVAQYEQLTGWLWVDSGNHVMARRCYDRALARSMESGSHALARYILACKSEEALMERRVYTAIMLAQEVQHAEAGPDGTWCLTPGVKAWAADLEARGLALVGEKKRCRQKLDEAQELLALSACGAGPQEPPWIYHFVPEALEVHRGICYTALGDAAGAIGVFDAAIAQVPEWRLRDRAYYLSWLARAHAGNNDHCQASEVARQAVELGLETESARVLKEVRLLHGELDPTLPAVRELGELLEHADLG